MLFRSQRNEGFALVSSIETDIRSLIMNISLSCNINIRSMISSNILDKCLNRAKKDSVDTSGEDIGLQTILNYSDIGDLVTFINILSKAVPQEEKRLKKIAKTLEPIIPSRNRICHSRPLEPEDFPLICEKAKSLILLDKSLNRISDAMYNLKTKPEMYDKIHIPDYWKDVSSFCPHNLPSPDFEDTGFIGRSEEIKKLVKSVLVGPSIISITGEGGLGKTAIALKLAYSIIDEDSPFEAIIWVSLKTRTLMPNNIQPISQAISDVRGIAEKIGVELGVPSGLDISDEIASYLRTFKILLFIDNLETIDPTSIIDILENVQGGTKVVITSRKGIGQLERVFPLKRFPLRDSKYLFRSFASLLNQKDLLKQDETNLDKTIHKLYYNPLAIKWYIASVAEGADQFSLLESRNQADLLEYCFKNIFDGLAKQSKKVLQVLYCAHRKLSSAELLFCVGDDLNDVPSYISSIRVLRSLNVITSESSEGYTNASLTEFCRSYLKESNTIGDRTTKEIKKSLSLIREAKEFSEKFKVSNVFNPECIIANNPEEDFISALLHMALSSYKEGNQKKAFEYTDRAISYAPHYGEAYRIKAYIFECSHCFDDARDAYEALFEVDPNNSRCLYLFASFLVNKYEDAFTAIDFAKKAYDQYSKIGSIPDSVLLQYAWLLVRTNRLSEANHLYEKEILSKFIDANGRRSRMAVSQAAECLRRLAEEQKGIHDINTMFDHLDKALSILAYKKDKNDWDDRLQKTADKIGREINFSKNLMSKQQKTEIEERLDSLTVLCG